MKRRQETQSEGGIVPASRNKGPLRILTMAALTGALLAIGSGVNFAANSIGVVSVEGGKISGVETDVSSVVVFKGIPFAGPTGGENRFKPPQPVAKWDGVKKADTWGDQVLQD